jgi:hypothetical protein
LKENEIIGALEKRAHDIALQSIQSPYEGRDPAYQLGLRQGRYRGLKEAVEIIKAILEDVAKKDTAL